jgi:hypothetical protein
VNPLSTILSRIPLGDRPGTPPQPPLAEPGQVHDWLHEVSGAHDGLAWRLAGGVPEALGRRLARGEHKTSESPRDELRALSEGEAIDAFSGRVAGPPGATPSERILQVAAWARACSEVLAARATEGRQIVSHQRIEGRWARAPLPTGKAPPHIGILDGQRLWIAESPAGRDLTDIGMDIGWALSLRKFEAIGPGGIGRAEIPAVVALDRRSIRDARHVHRTGGLEGPWMGVATGNRTHQAPPLELVAASRLEVEVAELAALMRRIHVLADQLLEAEDEDAPRAIARELTRKYGDLWRPRRSWRQPPRSDGREEYVARSLEGIDPAHTLDAFAYALGVALRAEGHGAHDTSASFRVPHQDRDVLTAVRFQGDAPEAFPTFRARLDTQRAREDAGFGLLTEWQRRLARQPIGPGAHRRLLAAIDTATRVDGPASALTGTAELSYSELPPRRDAPFEVYSGSTPPGGPQTTGLALHVHRVGDRVHVVLTGRGALAARRSAAELLDRILEALPR